MFEEITLLIICECIVVIAYYISMYIINSHIWKGDLVEITDNNFKEYGQQYFILFKIPDSKELYAVSKNKDAAIADFYVGKSQFKKVI